MTGSILITGASGGIGAETARHFLQKGWQVGLFARRTEALADVAAGSPGAHVLPGDVTDEEAVVSAVAHMVETSGRLDVVFANAGLFTDPAAIDEVPLSDWHTALDVNLTGMFLTARAAFGQMRRQSPQGGRIILNGSISAHVPREHAAPYTVTKHAITGLTKQIALDGRPLGISSSQIDIGNALTPMVEGIVRRARDEGLPEPATMPVEEVARAVWHLATLPAGTVVQQMTIMAARMPYIGRG